MIRVIVMPSAIRDIDVTTEYITESNDADIVRALQYRDRLIKRFDRLTVFPNRGRLRPEFGEGVRSLPAQPSVIFYRVVGDVVQILRVLDGRRDLQVVFFE